jgi:hypothetical protein
MQVAFTAVFQCGSIAKAAASGAGANTKAGGAGAGTGFAQAAAADGAGAGGAAADGVGVLLAALGGVSLVELHGAALQAIRSEAAGDAAGALQLAGLKLLGGLLAVVQALFSTHLPPAAALQTKRVLGSLVNVSERGRQAQRALAQQLLNLAFPE